MSLKGLRFTLNVDGIEETALAVLDFNLYEQHSAPFTLELNIASNQFNLIATHFLEKNATLTIWQGVIPLRYVSGIITSVVLGKNNDWQMFYRLVVVPPLWRCTLRKNFRIFQQQDIQSISATLLNDNGVTDWSSQFYESHASREFCVQYGESDLEFLTRLWCEEGIFFFHRFRPIASEQTLVLCDSDTGLVSISTFPFNPNINSAITAECINSIEYKAQICHSSIETKDYTFKNPGWSGSFGSQSSTLNGQFKQYEIYDYPGRFKDEQHGQDFARYQMEGWRHDAEIATCTSNSPNLWPGTKFTLTGHPSALLNKEWQVINSVLQGEQPQALHGSQGVGTTMTNEFDVIPADRTWRSRPLPKPKVDGPQSAIVTGPAGEEIFCDEHGRVRVKFHWDRYNQKDESSSCWVRVSQAWAGTGFGNLAIPRIGQEVIVDFLNGDPDQPIIMGRTYHQDNRSPGGLPGTKTQMTIRSKTYKGNGFNELRFEDATAKEQIYMHAQKDMITEVLHDKTTTVDHDHNETVKNNQTVTVVVGQTVKVGSKKEGGHDQKTTVANDQETTVLNDQKLHVVHDRHKNVDNDQTTTITGFDTETVVKDQKVNVKQSYTLDVSKETKIISGELIELTCGASSIKLEKSGTITITGKQFDFKASGPVNIKGKKIDLN
ncbi:TPA: type VI secretion system tip protein VgrG [Citrobacter amalonaticus]|uniref:Type VI secretion system tip protein VgrG n=1 Tax=Citrobacter amalonaticus TaxID=35703 RepID=A0A9C7V3Z6_CITAM|nr:type VI secretion system tip protein VgrG [Citrobacter amalonaticus]